MIELKRERKRERERGNYVMLYFVARAQGEEGKRERGGESAEYCARAREREKEKH